eukprot:jgi/Bigna1/75066/fgenesh1_pg.32_\
MERTTRQRRLYRGLAAQIASLLGLWFDTPCQGEGEEGEGVCAHRRNKCSSMLATYFSHTQQQLQIIAGSVGVASLTSPHPHRAHTLTSSSRCSSGPQNMTGDHGGDGDEEEAEARRLTSERLFIFTSMEEGTWRGEENNARGGQLYNDEEDNPGDNLAEEEAGGDADAPYEEEKEEGPFFSELVEMETRVEAGVIYESVLKTLLNLAVKNWDKAKTPVQKIYGCMYGCIPVVS